MIATIFLMKKEQKETTGPPIMLFINRHLLTPQILGVLPHKVEPEKTEVSESH